MRNDSLNMLLFNEQDNSEKKERRWEPWRVVQEAYETRNVGMWLDVKNPVEATCRCCGHRGLVDKPLIGVLKNERW